MLNKLIMMLFYPGGHGPLWDLATDAKSSALIEAFIRITNLFFVNIKVNKIFLVKGKKVTGFSNTEEAVGLTNVVPFLLEDALKANGASYSKIGDWPYAVEMVY
jgi:putative intracellular protease/amidase